MMPQLSLGQSIPPDTAHAVSVSLPTWRSNVGWGKGESWVVDEMSTGYPRFFIHKSVQMLAQDIASKFTRAPEQQAMLFPNEEAGQLVLGFLRAHAPASALAGVDIINLVLNSSHPDAALWKELSPRLTAVMLNREALIHAKQFWQHTGLGISSRRAELCRSLFEQDLLVPEPFLSRKQSLLESGGPTLDLDSADRSVKERFWRELLANTDHAKARIKRRIADMINHHLDRNGTDGTRIEKDFTDHIYIFPTGMSAIFNTHRFLLSARGNLKSLSFGFPYVDTLKILQKFGTGCVFYGNASEDELEDIQRRLEGGERFLALFCEFPGNPLLTSPNLGRIRSLADKYDFAVVVDETIGTFANVNVLQHADVVVTSLTKFFSGECNVMGGSAVFNPTGRYYSKLMAVASREYQHADTYWPEDAILMERNSRNFLTRMGRINSNAEAIAKLLLGHVSIKRVYYPKHNGPRDRANYEACRLPSGGYGGLISVVFHRKEEAIAFYDNLDGAKGPSLGTNFTLTSPYVVLAHMRELDWTSSLGVDPYLVRFSVGLEDTDYLVETFRKALQLTEGAVAGPDVVSIMKDMETKEDLVEY